MYKEAACPLELILWDLMTSEKIKEVNTILTSEGNTTICNRYLTPRTQEMHQIISGHLRSASGRIRKIREF